MRYQKEENAKYIWRVETIEDTHNVDASGMALHASCAEIAQQALARQSKFREFFVWSIVIPHDIFGQGEVKGHERPAGNEDSKLQHDLVRTFVAAEPHDCLWSKEDSEKQECETTKNKTLPSAVRQCGRQGDFIALLLTSGPTEARDRKQAAAPRACSTSSLYVSVSSSHPSSSAELQRSTHNDVLSGCSIALLMTREWIVSSSGMSAKASWLRGRMHMTERNYIV